MLDEPTTGLAPRLAVEAYDALAKLRDAGMTLVIAEQQVPLALELASRGYVLENGRFELAGTSAELADNAQVQRAYLGVA
jgi:branched-chain amino acid transport system ATP-binding protein